MSKTLSKTGRMALKQMFGGNCAYCGCELGDKWHADHVEPIMRQGVYVRVDKPNRSHEFKATGILSRPENDRLDNFFPACIPCNIHKSTHSIETFRKALVRHVDSLNSVSNYSIYRHAKRFGLIKEIEKSIVFHFEKSLSQEQK